jgi:hypothetical protein
MSKEEEIEDLVEKATQHLLRGELWDVYIIIYKLKRIATRE